MKKRGWRGGRRFPRTFILGLLLTLASTTTSFGALSAGAQTTPTVSGPTRTTTLGHPKGAPASPGAADPEKSAGDAGIDIGSIVETVQHHVTPGDKPGSLQSEDRLYRAAFDETGFRLTLRRPVPKRLFEPAKRAAGGRSPAVQRRRARRDTLFYDSAPRFSLSTTGIRMGSQVKPVGRIPWESELNVTRRPIDKGLTERFTALDGRLKWDFIMEAAPPAGGDLTLTAKVGLAGPPEFVPKEIGSRSGLPAPAIRWRLDGGRAVRLGEMVVVDATQKELYRGLPSPVPSSEELSMTVPARVLEEAAYPLTIDPVVSPEYSPSTVVHGKSADHQMDPAIASNGADFLVVWQDFRISGLNGDIHGARVTKEGKVLDPAGIVISRAPNDQFMPAVAFYGDHYLVVWNDCRSSVPNADIPCGPQPDESGQPAGDPNLDVFGARVTEEGKVLESTGIALAAEDDKDEFSPAVAADENGFFVAWAAAQCSEVQSWSDLWEVRSQCSNSDIKGKTVVAASGSPGPLVTISDPDPVSLDPGSPLPVFNEFAPSVASKGDGVLVVWEASNTVPSLGWDIFGAVFKEGQRTEPSPTAISQAPDDQVSPSVAWNGNNFMVVWEDYRAWFVYRSEIFGATVDEDLTSWETDQPGNITRLTPGYQTIPSVASDGENFAVVWEDWSSITNVVEAWGAIFDGTGMTRLIDIDAPDADGGRDQLRPKVAAVPTDSSSVFMLTWADAVCNDLGCFDGDARGAKVSLNGTSPASTKMLFSSAADSQWSPAVVWDPANFNYFVVWEDWDGGGESRIYGARVDAVSRRILDRAGIVITQSPGFHYLPSVAWNGTDLLVAWQSSDDGWNWDINGAVLNPATGTVTRRDIPISNGPEVAEHVSVAASKSTFFVAWQQTDDLVSEIFGTRFNARSPNPVLDPWGVKISEDGEHYRPRLAGAEDSFLAVWQTRPEPDARFDVQGASIAASNDLVRPLSFPPTNLADESDPSAAWSGSEFLVAWAACGSAPCTQLDIYGARLTPSAADPTQMSRSASFPISRAASDEFLPSVGWNGVNFFTAWNSCPADSVCENTDIRGARVAPGGTVLDGSGISVSSTQEYELEPEVAGGPRGQAAIVYQRLALEAPYGSDRAFLRLVDEVAAGLNTPAALTGGAKATFSETVKNLSTSNFVLRVAGTTGNVPAAIRCLNASSAVVGCVAGPVKTAALIPSLPLIPGQRYTVLVNPRGVVSPVVSSAGAPVSAAVKDFRASTQEQENSAAANYTWRTSRHLAAYDGSVTSERSSQASASYGFSGSSITWYTVTGPDQGIAHVLIDGSLKATIDNYSTTPQYKVARTLSGLSTGAHTIQIRPTGNARNAATDRLVSVDAFKAGAGAVVASPPVSYRLSPVSAPLASKGSYVQSDLGGAGLRSFVFRGTGVDWVTVKGPRMGRVTIYIDNRQLREVDNFSSATLYNQVHSISGLSDGIHTLKIVAGGSKDPASAGAFVAFDRFAVR